MVPIRIADPGSLTTAVGVSLLLPMRPEPLEVAAALGNRALPVCAPARRLVVGLGLRWTLTCSIALVQSLVGV